MSLGPRLKLFTQDWLIAIIYNNKVLSSIELYAKTMQTRQNRNMLFGDLCKHTAKQTQYTLPTSTPQTTGPPSRRNNDCNYR